LADPSVARVAFRRRFLSQKRWYGGAAAPLKAKYMVQVFTRLQKRPIMVKLEVQFGMLAPLMANHVKADIR
jgi:hypothetical protein